MSQSLCTPPITVALIEDDPELREQLRNWINRHPNLNCFQTFATAEDAIRALSGCKPDVWLVDINLPMQNGISFVAKLQEQPYKSRVLMLTAYEDSDRIFESLKAGASGYLLKRHAAKQLLVAIEQLKGEGAPMSPEVASKVVAYFHQAKQQRTALNNLSAREREILEQLSKGFASKEIASNMGISFDTVRTHLRHIYEKLHVQSRTEAVVKYLTLLE
jgi:DNA-binding NarL/FixJ family response regulator